MGWDELSTEQRHAHWSETERQMRALMQAVGGVLSEAEVEAVLEFIDQNELRNLSTLVRPVGVRITVRARPPWVC
jgi:hypothetical protein